MPKQIIRKCPVCDGKGIVRDTALGEIDDPIVRQIITETVEHYGFPFMDLASSARHTPIIKARHELMWRLRNEAMLPLKAIGYLLRRDHSTVIHGIQRYQARVNPRTA